MATTEMTPDELLAKLAVLGPMDDEQRNKVVCSLIGHSRIQTYCFGYYNCARCGEQLGDALGSEYPGAVTAVVVGHNCEHCRTNYEQCTWQDKLFAPDPFPAPTEAPAATTQESGG